MTRQPTPNALAGVGLLACSLILFEIALTRVFGIMMWHPLSYFVLSVGLLGVGAAGGLLSIRRHRLFDRKPDGPLALGAAAFSLVILVSFAMSTVIRLDSFKLWNDKGNFGALPLLYAVVATPMFVGGWSLGLALLKWEERQAKLVSFMAAGAALGCAVSAALLSAYGSAALIMIASACAALAAISLATTARVRVFLTVTPVLLLSTSLAICFTGGNARIGLPAFQWKIPFAPGKEMDRESSISARLPGADCEIQVSASAQRDPVMSGDFGFLERRQVEARLLTRDGTAPAMIFENASDIASFPFLDDSQAGATYLCHGLSGKKNPEVLIVGVDGGVDVMVGLTFRAKSITVLEPSDGIIRALTREFAEYTGGLFDAEHGPFKDRLEIIHNDGRSWVEGTEKQFDIIRISGSTAPTALQSGALPVVSSFLYTKESIHSLYERLHDGGLLSFSVRSSSDDESPRQNLRLVHMIREALTDLGLSDPGGRIMVFQGRNWDTVLVKNGEFARAEADALRTVALYEGFRGLLFDPTRERDDALAVESPSPVPVAHHFRTWLTQLTALMNRRIDLQEAGDDLARAFTAQFENREDEASSLVRKTSKRFPRILQGKAVNSIRAELDRVIHDNRIAAETFARNKEIFHDVLGRDDARRSERLKEYFFDLSVPTDDRPFFFDSQRWSTLLHRGLNSRGHVGAPWRYVLPSGRALLLASLIQLALFIIVLIYLPLRAISRQDAPPLQGTIRGGAYFGALGSGLGAIQFAIPQKLLVLSGHPWGATSIVLPAILIGLAIGARHSGCAPRATRSRFALSAAVIILGATLAIAISRWIGPLAYGAPAALRYALILLAAIPVGYGFGSALGLGLRSATASEPRLTLWLWGLLVFSAVFGALGAVAAAQAWGLTLTVLGGGGLGGLSLIFAKQQKETGRV